MSYVTVEAEVEIDLRDIEDFYFQEELDRRQIEASNQFKNMVDRGVAPLVDKVRFAMYSKDEKAFLEAAKEYFYERYNVIGDLSND